MPHDSTSPFMFRKETSATHEAERREERFEALMMRSWMQMRSRAAQARQRENA